MKTFYIIIGLMLPVFSFSQDIGKQLGTAMEKLQADEQFSHSLLGMYVVENKTGKVVYEKNSGIGMAPASCLKVVTSAAAFELMGQAFRYTTPVKIHSREAYTQLIFEGSGDPTLGSKRWTTTQANSIYTRITAVLKKKNISTLHSSIQVSSNGFTYQPVPDGWVWQDIGNYFGAGAWAFNWMENKYELSLASGNSLGDPTTVNGFDPEEAAIPMKNFITTGKKGSGDNAYLYTPPYATSSFATGTIPPGQQKFIVSGSLPDPALVFAKGLKSYVQKNGISITNIATTDVDVINESPVSSIVIDTIFSPSLDSMNFWFLKKSLNLFGEAFVKSMALKATGVGSTDSGVAVIRNYWNGRGIEKSSINFIDGSGLSPANRITVKALVQVMQYARTRPWYNSFYHALPEMNGIKMKDGYIGGVRAYTGYVQSKNGTGYTFSFIVNNFYGSPQMAREKMWKILDILK